MARFVWLAAALVSCAVIACADDGAGGPAETEPLAAVYVDPAAAAGGDGTLDAPVRSIDDALAIEEVLLDSMGARTIVLLAGAHGPPAQRVNAAVLRADVDGVVLGAPDAAWTFGALTIEGVALRGGSFEGDSLTLRGIALDGEVLETASTMLTVDGLRGGEFVWSLTDATANLRDLDVEQAQLVAVGTELSVSDARFDEGRGPIIGVFDGTSALTDVLIEGAGLVDGETVDDTETADFGAAVLIEGGSAELKRVTTVRSVERGVNLRGATVVAEDVVIRGAGRAGLGVQSRSGTEDTTRSDAVFDGLEISGGSVLMAVVASDVVVRDGFLEDGGAAGVLISGGAHFELYDSTVLDCPNGHLSLLGADTTGVIADNVVRGAGNETCISVSNTLGDVVVRGNTVSECAGSAISALGASTLTIEANDVSSIVASPLFPDVNEGISLVRTVADVRGNVVHDTSGIGISLLDSAGTLSGNVVRDVGDVGIRVTGMEGGEAVLDGEVVERAGGAALLALETMVTVRNSRLADTAFTADFGGGMGAGVSGPSTLVLEDSVIEGNAEYGVFVDAGSTLTSSRNRYEDNGPAGVMCLPGVTVSSDGDTFADHAVSDVAEECGLSD